MASELGQGELYTIRTTGEQKAQSLPKADVKAPGCMLLSMDLACGSEVTYTLPHMLLLDLVIHGFAHFTCSLQGLQGVFS